MYLTNLQFNLFRRINIYIIYFERVELFNEVHEETLSNQSKKIAYSKTFQIFNSSCMWCIIILFYLIYTYYIHNL